MAKSTNKKRPAPKEVEAKKVLQRNIQKPTDNKVQSSSDELSSGDEVKLLFFPYLLRLNQKKRNIKFTGRN